ncbi:MAG: hypothetical protein IT553_09395 [Sphingomonadaceae bacterium]|nr:hypothetical protein [Sphingomonadaceae bacterium]
MAGLTHPEILHRSTLGDALSRLLPRGARVLVQGGAGESPWWLAAMAEAGTALPPLHFTGALLPGINDAPYLPHGARQQAFFLTPALRRGVAAGHVDFLPIGYSDIWRHLADGRIDAALMMLTPPDADGQCSFGIAQDFLAEIWPQIPLRIAHINPAMPRTHGAHIPYGALHAVVEGAVPLFSPAEAAGDDPVASAIAAHVARIIPDGACIQTGIGKLPGAILAALTTKRDLRIYSGLIGDGVLSLIDAGALASGRAITTGLAVGSPALYAKIAAALDQFHFCGVSETHGFATIAAIPQFCAINGAMSVDLWGQIYSEVGPKGLASGPGGLADFARGARASAGGLSIIALPARAGVTPRIVAPGAGAGPVTLGRGAVDIVVSEFGIADLRHMGHGERAARLIAIAHPDDRAGLSAAWAETSATL